MMNSKSAKGRTLNTIAKGGNAAARGTTKAIKSYYGDTPGSIATNAALTFMPYGKIAKGALKATRETVKGTKTVTKGATKRAAKVAKGTKAAVKKAPVKKSAPKKYNRGR